MSQPERARSLAQQQGQELFPANSTKESLLLSARVWKTWILVAIYFTTFGGFIAMTSWLPTYWSSFLAVSAVTAGGLTALYSILCSLVRIAGGSIADRMGGERTAVFSLFVTLIGAVIMSVSHDFGFSILGKIVMALGMGVCNAAVFKIVPKEVPQAVGGASGWIGGLGAFGGFAIPPILSAFVRAQKPDEESKLLPGRHCQIKAGRIHQLENLGDDEASYLLVQGVGKYDFN